MIKKKGNKENKKIGKLKKIIFSLMELKIINKGSYFFSLYNAINSFININNFNYVLYYSEVFII